MSDGLNTVWILVPCYNEGKMLPEIYHEFVAELHNMKNQKIASEKSILLFIDDGSSDNTWEIIENLSNEIEDVHGLKLKQNAGQLHALMAGLMLAKELNIDATITIDCDGQDDIHTMSDMMCKFNEGYDIVYGVRNNRDSDTWLKRNTALAYYKFMRLFDKSFVYNHSEFRLMSHRVLEYLDNHGEYKPFLRKICFALSHYEKLPSTCSYYTRKERIAGETHYSFWALFKLALISMKPVNHEVGHVSHDEQYQIEKCTYVDKDLSQSKLYYIEECIKVHSNRYKETEEPYFKAIEEHTVTLLNEYRKLLISRIER